jgi:hypothetical protein
MAQAYVRANATNVRAAWQELRKQVEQQLKSLPRR